MMPENILKTMHLKRDGPKITILKQNHSAIYYAQNIQIFMMLNK